MAATGKAEVWFYDYRTNVHHTLKKKPLRFEDLQDFISCYNPANRQETKLNRYLPIEGGPRCLWGDRGPLNGNSLFQVG
jgi:type I restriction-modification system DNA methylase subunit